MQQQPIKINLKKVKYFKIYFLSLLFLIQATFIIGQVNKLSLKQILDSAKTNNPHLQNLILSAQLTGIKGGFINIHPTDISYYKGNLYSAKIDTRTEITQNFGSPATWIANKSLQNEMVKLGIAESELNSRVILASIKSAYYNCVYYNQRLSLLKELLSVCSEAYPFDSISVVSNDTLLLEKIISESNIADLESRKNQAYNDYLISQNNLVQQAFLNHEAEPSNSQLEMYEIEVNTDTSTRTPSNLFRNYYKHLYLLSKEKVKVEKSRFFPEIKAGYSNNSINGTNGYSIWQVGVSLPIWIFEQNNKVKAAKIEQKIAQNELTWQHSNIDATTANILTDLNKYFEQLNYFNGFALKQSQTLLETSKRLFESRKISFNNHIQNIQAAYKIKLDYLETLINYNLKAIELEVYAY